MSVFEGPHFWHWLILGVAFLILEVFAPGTFFLWMAVAAAVVGGLLYLMPDLAWEYQLLVFALLSVVSIVVARIWLRGRPQSSEDPLLNRRGHQYVGRTFLLDEPVLNGRGRVHVDDSYWKVVGPDCPAGTRIEVVGVEGTRLRVEPRSE